MKLRLILGLILISPCFLLAQVEGANSKKMRDLDAFEYLKTHDIQTGLVPKENLYEQMEMLSKIEESSNKNEQVGATDKWIELGPINKGGQVKAMVIIDNNGKKLAFAGGSAGGLWTCEDISVTTPYWRRVNDYFDNLNISCIVVHPSNPNIMFFGTGDGWRNPFLNGNSANPISLKGGGVWRSLDKGKTWFRLASTTGSDFSYIQRMAITSNGNLLVGTLNGLFKSIATGASAGNGANQPTAWTETLASGNYLNKSVADIEINGTNIFISTGVYTPAGGQSGLILRSTNNATSWTDISGGVGYTHRVELASTPNQPNVLFASVSDANGEFDGIIRSVNALSGGVTWTALPTNPYPTAPYTIISSWAHNTLVVSPATTAITPINSIILYAGYEEMWRGFGGTTGNNWTKISNSPTIHVDQKLFVFEPGSASKMYICNDGGIYRCNDITATPTSYTSINNNLFVMQFYTCAIDNNYLQYLGGAQDNSTILLNNSGLSVGIPFAGGDGAYCHFDDVANQFITASQQESIIAHNNGVTHDFSLSFPNTVIPNNWLFITPTELDKANDKLYVSGENNQIFRIDNVFSPLPTIIELQIPNMNNKRASVLKLSPNTTGLLYIGTEDGRVLALSNANTVGTGTQSTTVKTYGICSCYISSIDIKKNNGSDDELVYTISNYGSSSIVYTSDITTNPVTWTSIDNPGALGIGDIPVRTVVFAPDNNTQTIQLLIGTDLGVYSTDQILGLNTPWYRYPIYKGMPYVRVDMLKIAESTAPVNAANMLVAATYGRGMMRSDMFCTSHIDYSVSPANAGSNCTLTFSDISTGFSNTYKKQWAVWHAGTLEQETPSNVSTNPFTLDCWDLDMTVYLKLLKPNGEVAMRVGKPLYYVITPSAASCNGCINQPTKTEIVTEISVYPNPSEDGIFYIKNGDKIKEGNIFDVSGRKILSFNQTEIINIQNQVSGIYFYQLVTQDGETQTGKLIRE